MMSFNVRSILPAVALASAVLFGASVVDANEHRTTGRNAPEAPVIYVIGQDLYYDSIVLTPLPMEGNFQLLVSTMDGLETEFGPGDPGYLGGRWWLDMPVSEEEGPNGVMDEGDAYFMCPLLGPGREEP